MPNFKSIHHFLSGLSGRSETLAQLLGHTRYKTPVISDSGGGVFITKQTAFLEHRLVFGVFVRNTSGNKGVKKSIKLIISPSSNVNGKTVYQGNMAPNEIYAELGIADISMILNVIEGGATVTSIQGSDGSIINLSINAIGNIEVSCSSLSSVILFDHEAKFNFMATIAEFALLCHPDLPPELSMRLIKDSGCSVKVGPNLGSNKHSANSTPTSRVNGFTSDMLEAVNDLETLKMALVNAFSNEPPVTQKTCSVLWAIGNSRWNRGMDGLNIISVIQSHGSESYARSLVDSANKNDLSRLEDLYARIF